MADLVGGAARVQTGRFREVRAVSASGPDEPNLRVVDHDRLARARARREDGLEDHLALEGRLVNAWRELAGHRRLRQERQARPTSPGPLIVSDLATPGEPAPTEPGAAPAARTRAHPRATPASAQAG